MALRHKCNSCWHQSYQHHPHFLYITLFPWRGHLWSRVHKDTCQRRFLPPTLLARPKERLQPTPSFIKIILLSTLPTFYRPHDQVSGICHKTHRKLTTACLLIHSVDPHANRKYPKKLVKASLLIKSKYNKVIFDHQVAKCNTALN